MKKESLFGRIKKSNYVQNFRNLNSSHWYIVLFDVLFLIVSLLLSQLFSFLMSTVSIERLQELRYNASQALVESGLEQGSAYTQQLTGMLSTIVLYLVLFVVLLVLNWSFFRMMVYQFIYKKQFSLRTLGSYFAANLAITALFIAILYILSSTFKQTALPYALISLVIIFIYFTTLFYHFYFYTGRIRSGITLAFSKGISQFHRFGLAWILIIITGALLNIPFSLLGYVLPDYLKSFVYIPNLLFTLVWSRTYLAAIVREVVKK